ncbi:DUF692 family multinuclear iron-containing protein [Streptomyces sp. NPDC087844]|uniref:multinuclear nonheme iron-dependent oxidase n=1 Tax=Streptomyces sp. NPDC087844 TaxID=3365805 RepID=UPI00381E700B
MRNLGTGIGWRPEIAEAVERMPGIDWVEAVAENVCPGHLPESLVRLRERGVTVVPHGVSLGLGGADRPAEAKLADLAARAEALGSPLVTEHIAFVRAGGALTASPLLEAGHLLPVPRTRDALDVLCENVRIAQDALPVPLAVENIAALICWPGEEMTEGQFLYDLVDRTGVRLLIDVANLHTNHVNRGEDPARALDELPVEAIAYVHVAGGFERDGVWHDSHAHAVPPAVLDVLAELASRVRPPGVLLERDENFPEPAELERELIAIRETVEKGAASEAATPRSAAPARTGGDPGTGSGPRSAGATRTGRRTETAGATKADRLPKTDGTTEVDDAPKTVARTGTVARMGAGGDTEPVGVAGVVGVAKNDAAAEAPRVAGAGGSRISGPAAQPATGDSQASVVQGEAQKATGDGRASVVGAEARAPIGPARQRLALAQAALLSALVAGTPVPEGFDRARLAVQARALAGKRADVVAKVAPELTEILAEAYRKAFLAYAHGHPMADGYRRDALDFAEHLLFDGRLQDADVRRRVSGWWLERSGPAPLSQRPAARLVRATRRVLLRR